MMAKKREQMNEERRRKEEKSERERGERREKVTRRKTQKGWQKRFGREDVQGLGAAAVESGGGGVALLASPAARAPRTRWGAGRGLRGRCSLSALAFGRCGAFVPYIHFLPQQSRPRAQSSPTYFAESDSLQGVWVGGFPPSHPQNSPGSQRVKGGFVSGRPLAA